MLFYSRSNEKQRKKQKYLTVFNYFFDDDYEHCVLCGKKTNIKKSELVDRRVGYFPGAGQLCYECALKNIEEEFAAMQKGYNYVMPVYSKDVKDNVL